MPEPGYRLNAATERAFVRQVLADPLVMPRVARHLRAAGFAVAEVRELVAAALSYWKKTGSSPTGIAVLEEVRAEVNAGRVPLARVAELANFMEDCRDAEPIASDYAVRRVLDAERDRAIWNGIEQSIKLFQEGKKDDVLAVIQRADAIGKVDALPGIDYGGTLAHRTEQRLRRRAPRRWGTGILELDDLMDGGLSLDNPMGVVLGGPKWGKSQYLHHVAMHHMAIGGYAVYFGFENGQGEITDQMDAAIAMVPIKEVHARAAEVKARVSAFLEKSRGGMHLKKFSGGRVTSCRDLDHYLEELRLEQSIQPTCIIVDYADLMAANDPSRYDKRHEELAAIYEEVRALFEKHGCVGWTASQIKQDALEKKVPSIGDIAGAFAKAAIADVVVAICRTEEERQDEKVRFFVAASRFSQDGVQAGPLPSAYGVGRIVVGA